MKKHTVWIVAVGILLIIASAMTGCRGKSSSSSGQTAVAASDKPAFNVSGSKQLVALSNTVASASGTSGAGVATARFALDNPFALDLIS